jgi:hypothetical protein
VSARKAKPGQVFTRVEYRCHGSAVWVLEHQADEYALPCHEFAPHRPCQGQPVPTQQRMRLLGEGWELVDPTPTSPPSTSRTSRRRGRGTESERHLRLVES